MISLGLEWTDSDDPENSTNLPELVDRLKARATEALGASASAFIDELVGHIRLRLTDSVGVRPQHDGRVASS